MQQWEVEAYARQEGFEEGIAQGISQGISQGIQTFIQAFINEGIPKERIIEKLMQGFSLSEQEALDYYVKFSK